jgi:two-component system chemotaxis response regulator CheY
VTVAEKKLILIVDDSETMLMSLSGSLTYEGFEVETAQDGLLALAKLNDGLKPALIITDMSMPNMDGIDFIKNVRAMINLRFIPIIAFTTATRKDLREQSKQAGATAWLVKPTPIKELVDIINTLLQKK